LLNHLVLVPVYTVCSSEEQFYLFIYTQASEVVFFTAVYVCISLPSPKPAARLAQRIPLHLNASTLSGEESTL